MIVFLALVDNKNNREKSDGKVEEEPLRIREEQPEEESKVEEKVNLKGSPGARGQI